MNEDNPSELLLQVPDDGEDKDYGLWISWDGNWAQLRLVQDKRLSELHTNIYAPASITNTRLLKGGGSGTTVFAGDLPSESLVWKHGNHKDMGEVFALAEIEHELLRRSETAAQKLRSRIPRFRGVYVSPNHIRVRSHELWGMLRRHVKQWALAGESSDDDSLHNSLHGPTSTKRRISVYGGITEVGMSQIGTESSIIHSKTEVMKVICGYDTLEGLQRSVGTSRMKRRSSLQGGTTKVDVSQSGMNVYLGNYRLDQEQVICGYDALKELAVGLRRLQAKHLWKYSLAQSRIGGDNPRTAAFLLAKGLLRGDTLKNLIDQYFDVLHGLQQLTSSREKDVVKDVKLEVQQLSDDASASDISPLADAFVGHAILKNYHPKKGRFKRIRETLLGFQNGSLVLRPDEELPAQILVRLGEECRNRMADIFLSAPSEYTALYEVQDTWVGLLRDATHLKGKAALQRVWNCGLTDGGLHNMFFSDGQLWLFDLGKPSLAPLPAFLTKFLMSFFHSLGMEDTADGTSWVNRFSPEADKLVVTEETQEKLSFAYEAFTVVLDRLVNEIFDDEEEIRGVLIKYVILQLLSDSAFCLERWENKGGGSPSFDNHHTGLEKWLWRSIWDIYVASCVSHTFNGDLFPSDRNGG